MNKRVDYVSIFCSCVADCQEYLITGSISGKLEIRNITTKGTIFIKAGGSILSMGVIGDNIYIGTEFGEIEIYSLCKGTFLSYLATFLDPVAYITTNKKLIFALTGEKYINCWSLENSIATHLIYNNDCSKICSLEVSPYSPYLAINKTCGTTTVWRIIERRFQKIQDFNCDLKECKYNFKSFTKITMSWSCRHELAVPERNGVHIYKLGDKITPVKLTFENEQMYTIACFSQSGGYLCCGNLSGTLLVWTRHNHQIIFHTNCFTHILQIVFTNSEQNLQVLDGGNIVEIKNFEAVQPTLNETYDRAISDIDFDDRALYGGLQDIPDKRKADLKLKTPLTQETKDNDPDTARTNLLKQKLFQMIQQSSLLSTKPNSPSKTAPKSQMKSSDRRFSKTQMFRSVLPGNLESDGNRDTKVFAVRHENILTWNNFGTIEINGSYIFISTNHTVDLPIKFKYFNKERFNLASLGKGFAVFANSGSSKLKSMVQRFLFSTKRTDWCITLPKDEYALGLAIGNNWIVACTNFNKIRVFDHNGQQKHIIDIAQRVEYIVGHNDLLFIISNTQWTSNFNESFYSVYKFSKIQTITGIINHYRLPMRNGCTVKWVGFTDEGSPTFSDSENSVRILKKYWTEIFYSKQMRHNSVINFQGVNETNKTVRYYDCSHTSVSHLHNFPFSLLTKRFKVPKCQLAYFRNQSKADEIRASPDDFVDPNNTKKNLASRTIKDLSAKNHTRIRYVQGNLYKSFKGQSAIKGKSPINNSVVYSSIKSPQTAAKSMSTALSGGLMNKKRQTKATKTAVILSTNSKPQITISNTAVTWNKKKVEIMKRKELRRLRFLNSLILESNTNRLHLVQTSRKLRRAALFRIRHKQT